MNLLILKKLLNNFLFSRGFEIIKKDSYIKSIRRNFNFSKEWSFVRSKSGSFLDECNKNYLKNYKRIIKGIIKNSKNNSIFELIKLLNSEIIEWKLYFKISSLYSITANELDIYLNKILWNFVKHYHPRRTNTWIYNKYWKNFNGTWKFFSINSGSGKFLILMSHNSKRKFKIHYRIHSLLNVFNLFNKRKFFKINFKKSQYNFIGIYSFLYNKQKGICVHCKYPLNDKKLKLVNVNPSFNKKSSLIYLFLLHKNCFFQS